VPGNHNVERVTFFASQFHLNRDAVFVQILFGAAQQVIKNNQFHVLIVRLYTYKPNGEHLQSALWGQPRTLTCQLVIKDRLAHDVTAWHALLSQLMTSRDSVN